MSNLYPCTECKAENAGMSCDACGKPLCTRCARVCEVFDGRHGIRRALCTACLEERNAEQPAIEPLDAAELSPIEYDLEQRPGGEEVW